MAQTKKTRRRKHRGTQAGTIERAGRTAGPGGSRPAGGGRGAPGDAREAARARRAERYAKPPTWNGAIRRAALIALVLGVFSYVALDQTLSGAAFLTLVALAFYVPMSYFLDLAVHRRYLKRNPPAGRR